jgi:HSP20 family molecular chaperone IbpA
MEETMGQQWNWSRETMEPSSAARSRGEFYETAGGEAFVIEVPVQGLKPDEIVIEATTDSLTVSTHPHNEQVQPMSRLFVFPVDIDTDNVRVALEDGTLKIRIPKAAAAPRKVLHVGQSA